MLTTVYVVEKSRLLYLFSLSNERTYPHLEAYLFVKNNVCLFYSQIMLNKNLNCSFLINKE